MLCLCVFVVVLLGAESCNLPSQFEAKESVLNGVMPLGSNIPIVSQMYVNVSYDAINKKIAARGNSTDVGTRTSYGFIQIDDYQKRLRYTVTSNAGSRCIIQKLTEDFPDPKALIGNATKLESGYFGIGKTKTRFDSYLLNIGQITYNFALDEQCMVIDETFYGQQGNNRLIGSAGIYNATIGIQDPSVFKIPDICKKAVNVPAAVPDHAIGRHRRSIF